MKYTATKLRQNLYRVLDSVIEEGLTVEIERRGHIIKIVPEDKPSIWGKLEVHDVVSGDSEDLVSGNWYEYWNEGNNL